MNVGMGAVAIAAMFLFVAPAQAASDGKRIQPDFPEGSQTQSCVGLNSKPTAGTMLNLNDCRLPRDNFFAVAHDGTITIAAHPELCIATAGPVTKDGVGLELVRCAANTPKWIWAGKAGRSGTIRSEPGVCWAYMPMTENEHAFPFVLSAMRCSTGGMLFSVH